MAENNHLSQDQNSEVDLNTDGSLLVDISDAISERERVKFTVHTKTTLPKFTAPEFSVQRQHEEFVWLHDTLAEEDNYAGLIIPPAPPRPDFDESREKLQRLGEGEATMTKEEFSKMKAELEAEYLAIFKKTVAMHEVFLQRLTQHSELRNDENLRVFLEYKDDLSVRGKSKKEKFTGFFRNITKSADEVLLQGQKDPDQFFDTERRFLSEYHVRVKDACTKGDRMTSNRKSVADCYIKVADCMLQLATADAERDNRLLMKRCAETMEKLRKLEGRVASDEDLKLSDTFRYYWRDTQAAKNLLYRRSRALADFDNANKAVDKQRAKGKDMTQVEDQQRVTGERFEKISTVAKEELEDFKARRIAHFKKNLIDMVELQLKSATAQCNLLQSTITEIQTEM